MTGTLFIAPRYIPVNNTGLPLAGAKLYFTLAGTSTATDVYTTSAMSVAHAVPVEADANGVFAAIYLDPAVSYKVRMTDSAGTQVYIEDNLPTSVDATTAAETAASVTVTDASYAPGDPRRYGAALDGATDDTAALVAAIAQQQQAGGADVIGVPNTTLYVESWTTQTLTAKFVLRGNGMTIQSGDATSVSFVTLKNNFDITDCIFDGWFRVISNTTAVTESITEGRFERNKCINATANSSQNAYYVVIANPVENLWILDNIFVDGLVTAVYVGANTYANQDTWARITISGNVIDGVTAPTEPAAAFGILVYGRDVVVDGNDISGVEGPASAGSGNGAYGIYTKARFNRIVNNSVRDVGTTTDADVTELIGINLKGADRTATSTPQGYGTICSANAIKTVGVADTSGVGISTDHSGVLVESNWVEDAGLKGISIADSSATATDANMVCNNVVVGPSTSFTGIDVIPRSSQTMVDGNAVNGATGIYVRSSGAVGANVVVSNNSTRTGNSILVSAASYNLSNVLIAGNTMVDGANGITFSASGGGVLSDIMLTDNDWSAATNAAVVGTLPTTARIRNNRGYVSENCGVTSTIASGATVSHGCGATPTVVLVTALESGPTDVYVTEIGASTFKINFGGGGNKSFAWEAKTAAFYA